MPRYLWMLLFAFAVGTGIAATDDDPPPWEEGPQAHRMNQMSEEAPHGPWSWHGGE